MIRKGLLFLTALSLCAHEEGPRPDRAQALKETMAILREWNEKKEEVHERKPFAESKGKWINPFTDVCWRCMFPLRVGGADFFQEMEKAEKVESFWERISQWGCKCGDDHWGVPISFWEVSGIVEVTPTPHKILIAKGWDLSDQKNAKLRGGISHVGESGRTSFYHVHYYPLPLFRILAILPGFNCLQKGLFSEAVPYYSEFEPTWRYPAVAALFDSEMFLKNGPSAQEKCIEDCAASNQRAPRNDLWWCSGCLGSLYPLTGHVAHHIGGLQSSSLLVHRVLAKRDWIRNFLFLGTYFEDENFCKKTRMKYPQKTHIKTQLLYPVPDKEKETKGSRSGYCHFLGQGVEPWAAGKTYPEGEDFMFVVWSKMNCCYSIPGAVKRIFSGGADLAAGITEEMEKILKEMPEKAFEAIGQDAYEDVLWQPWEGS